MGQAKQRGSFEERKKAAENAAALEKFKNNGRMPRQYKYDSGAGLLSHDAKFFFSNYLKGIISK